MFHSLVKGLTGLDEGFEHSSPIQLNLQVHSLLETKLVNTEPLPHPHFGVSPLPRSGADVKFVMFTECQRSSRYSALGNDSFRGPSAGRLSMSMGIMK